MSAELELGHEILQDLCSEEVAFFLVSCVYILCARFLLNVAPWLLE